jgi:hypothetical protein
MDARIVVDAGLADDLVLDPVEAAPLAEEAEGFATW